MKVQTAVGEFVYKIICVFKLGFVGEMRLG